MEHKALTSIEHYRRIQSEAANSAFNCTCHYLTILDNLPVPHGSGVFVKINDTHFVFTAAHVIEDKLDSIYIATGGNSVVHLGGRWLINEVEGKGGRNSDRFDFAVLILHEKSVIDVLELHEFLDASEVGLNHELKNFPCYTAVGFPASQNRHDKRSRIFTSNPFIYTTSPAELEVYKQLSCNPKTNIIVHYDKKNVGDNQGKKLVGPDPYGMSGGGLWYVEFQPSVPGVALKKQLVGILIEWPVRNRKVWICSRIDNLIRAIQHNFEL